jgi:hypothetical protein
MRNFPKWINTAEDVNNCLAEYPVETKAFLQGLLDNRFMWQSAVLPQGDAGVNDQTHMVVQQPGQDGAIQNIQLTQAEDPNARLFQLGLTVTSAQAMIAA